MHYATECPWKKLKYKVCLKQKISLLYFFSLQVALLQETVRRECQEREELTAALSTAQVELLGLRCPSSHQASTRSPPNPTERHTPPGNKHFQLQSPGRAPLTRWSTSPNTLRPPPARTDKGRGSTDGGGAGKSVESWNGGGEKQREGTLPRLRARSTVSEGKSKVPSVMWRRDRQQQAKQNHQDKHYFSVVSK